MATSKKEKNKKKKEDESFRKRDMLLGIQEEVQQRWHEARVFEIDAPAPPANPHPLKKKFFGNFPYPYMNGALHLGHAFSLSKLVFASGFFRMQGCNVMLPFGFHCTGMPIKACADKLRREMEQFGNPPQFPAKEVGDDASLIEAEARSDKGKYKSKKAKAQAKSGGEVYQWNIMTSLRIPVEEIPNFIDPTYWLRYFPPIAIQDLKNFGAGIDWRRSFITTELNPYYDSFVKWQLRALQKQNKVLKGMRYAIYSPRDGQPCADHDRASGEGVEPQEYTLVKLQLARPFTGKLQALQGKNVFLAAATTRPETMYGQTNAWVLPDGMYGAYEVNEMDIFIVTSRAACNLAFQFLSKVPKIPTCLLELTGQDLIGMPLIAPLSIYNIIYVLPLKEIELDKGTGVVTSVPSDSPKDYTALLELKNNPNLRVQLGVKDEWVLPYDPVPIINIPDIGDKSAEVACLNKKFQSHNEKVKLAEAVKYLKDFSDGVMMVSEYEGQKVQDAKPHIEKMLLERGFTVKYCEPKSKVISRSGDECVVALTDQWYLNYGEAEWKAKAKECFSMMELYNEETRHAFEQSLGWLGPHACSRSFGLGTKMPWDEQCLVDSLSDSTIYMAYYTIAHLLQGGDIYGHNNDSIKAEQLSDEVWNYIFLDGPSPSTDIPETTLKRMKQEFEYWYPFDLRVSGKDLIQNHLTFCIYNHSALFPKEKWPKSFRCNGFLMLNSKKMAKQTGNFMTLSEAIEKYSADATRLALADAGDLNNDANFSEETASKAACRLTNELAWIKEVQGAGMPLRDGPATQFADRVFENEINIAVHLTEHNYESLMFREALKTGMYDLQLARDEYRVSCGALGMNRNLVLKYIMVETQLLTPLCPHFAEYVWSTILGKEGFAVEAKWPTVPPADLTLQRANRYLQTTIIRFRKLLQKQTLSKSKPTIGFAYVAEQYDGWKEECMKVLQMKFDVRKSKFATHEEIMDALLQTPVAEMGDIKQIKKMCFPFIKLKMEEALAVGFHALGVEMPFDEMQVIEENLEFMKRNLGLEKLNLFSFKDRDALRCLGTYVSVLHQSPPFPGCPMIIFLSEEMLQKGSD